MWRDLNQRWFRLVCLFALFCALAATFVGFGGTAQSSAIEPTSVGRATNLVASTAGQDDGTVRLTWTAAPDAQVHFVVYLKTSDLVALNVGQARMAPFAGTEGVITGLEGGTEYSFIVTGMRWNWVRDYGAVWGTWSNWRTATPRDATADMGAALPITEPTSVGQVTNLVASTAGQDDGTVRLTWTAAPDAQVHFVVYLKTSDLVALNVGQARMAPFAGTEGVITGLEGGTEYSFIVTGMRWNWVRDYGAVWGTWSQWQPATPLPISPVPEDGRLTTFFDDIISKTERREAFSPIKESNIGFSALDDMRALRAEFVASKTDEELYWALVKLSNARRDRHLHVRETDGGILPQGETTCEAAPIYVLPDLSDDRDPTFFVARLRSQLTSPQVGDAIVAVNGLSMEEYIREFTNWIRHSTLHGLYWRMADELPKKGHGVSVPQSLYSERLNLTLQRSTGGRYHVSLPYTETCGSYGHRSQYPGFQEVMQTEYFNVWLDRDRQIVLLQWFRFRPNSLIRDIPALMEYAEREQILEYDIIIDVTRSGGGAGGAYVIQRLVDRPFRVTFGNVRLSDLGVWLVEHFAAREPNANAPDIFGLNLSGSWLIDWARTDAMEAIRRGDEYTPPVPFKLAHLPKDSDGMLQPAPVHFSGKVAIINAGVWGGSHLDQFMAMFVDNDLATFIGMPTGGYSNTWEVIETLRMPDTRRPLARFMWSAGHTIRPNGEILEGNPAEPHEYIPLTRENFQGYHQTLFNRAMAVLGR